MCACAVSSHPSHNDVVEEQRKRNQNQNERKKGKRQHGDGQRREDSKRRQRCFGKQKGREIGRRANKNKKRKIFFRLTRQSVPVHVRVRVCWASFLIRWERGRLSACGSRSSAGDGIIDEERTRERSARGREKKRGIHRGETKEEQRRVKA